MQTRYWESWVRPLLLVSREALSWQLIICLVSIKDAGLGLGLWLLTSLRHPSLRLREINFPLADEYPVKLVKLHEPWAISPPGPVFVDSERVSHCLNVTRWPLLISGDMFWIFWQCCPGLWLHSSLDISTLSKEHLCQGSQDYDDCHSPLDGSGDICSADKRSHTKAR